MITTLEVDYENPWMYEGNPFTSDDIGDYYGFVYRITNTTNGKQYIGRKYFIQNSLRIKELVAPRIFWFQGNAVSRKT